MFRLAVLPSVVLGTREWLVTIVSLERVIVV